MRPWLGSFLLLMTVLLSRAAAADESTAGEPAALSWLRGDGAASCPSADEVTRAIEQRLGHATFVAKEQAEFVIQANLEGPPGGGFRVQIKLLRGDAVLGQRELMSDEPTCQGVAETAALVIALTLDPEASLEPLPIPVAPTPARSAPGAARVAPSTATPSIAIDSPEIRTPKPMQGARWQGDLELGAGIATGIVPKVAAGVHVRGRALPPTQPFGIELEAVYFPSKRLEARAGKGADFTALYLTAGLCSRPTRARRFVASLCAGAEAGTISGQGYGFQIRPEFRTWTFALAARGTLWFRVLRPLALVLGPSIAVPLKRDYFETKTPDGTEPLFRMSPLGLGFELGLVWEL